MRKLFLFCLVLTVIIAPIVSYSMFTRVWRQGLKRAPASPMGLNFALHGKKPRAFEQSGLRFSSYATGPDNYKILGVSPSASTRAIKKAYLKRALQYHPDMVDFHEKKAAEEQFKRIKDAYEVLSSGKKSQQQNNKYPEKQEETGYTGKVGQMWKKYKQARKYKQAQARRQREREQEWDEYRHNLSFLEKAALYMRGK